MEHAIKYRFAFQCLMCRRWTLTNIAQAKICDTCLDNDDERLDRIILSLAPKEEECRNTGQAN